MLVFDAKPQDAGRLRGRRFGFGEHHAEKLARINQAYQNYCQPQATLQVAALCILGLNAEAFRAQAW
jgi:hypothetical protein